MQIAPGRWHRLNVETIEALPNAPAVFEIGTLVRTVLYVGRAEGRLRDHLSALGPVPNHLPPAVGGYYVRYELTPAEDESLTRCLKTHQARHRGRLPVGNTRDQLGTPDTRRAA